MDGPRIDRIDADIIRLLEADARMSMAKIASRVSVPKSTVRHRINRLVQRKIIEFAATTNPLQLGYEIWVIIDLRVQFGKIESVARRVAEAPEVYFAGIMTGSRDLLVGAVFKSNADLLDFLISRLSKIPGINETSTSTVLKIIKRTVSWPLPNDSGPARRQAARTRAYRRSGRGKPDG